MVETIVMPVLAWYVIAQLLSLAALPLALRVGRSLPDRGITLVKMLGILLLGLGLWLGVSYGLLRNERGGAWVAFLLVGAVAWGSSWREIAPWWGWLRRRGNWRMLMVGEVIFGCAFVLWAMVRAYDPAANHTEQPMDLMFMNSLWASPTYPPQDAWMAGYAISYYYFGYWLLVTVARLADVPPALAYNVGQACWYGLLWLGSFGVATNLLAAYRHHERDDERRASIDGASMAGGAFAGMAVALSGNLQVLLEWLYARGAPVDGLARWIGVDGFPERATRSGQWFIGYDWWWWRSSRVLEDLDLAGNHIEVIDEFPAFSYLLGDNHPHVLAMPVVLLAIGLALGLYLAWERQPADDASVDWWRRWPGGWVGMALTAVTVGSLVFINTWDFPPYWALVVATVGLAGVHGNRQWFAWKRAVVVGLSLIVATGVVYLPYFLTAQSQAGGVIPNLFYPTRLTQFLVMFGAFVPAIVATLLVAWRTGRPEVRQIGLWVGGVVGGAALALVVVGLAATSLGVGRNELLRVGLPDGMSYGGAMLQRWLAQPWTMVLTGSALGIVAASLIALRTRERSLSTTRDLPARPTADPALPFVLLLLGLGFSWVFIPEVVYLRDNFGTRMNTIFKFYYQAWLLFALVTAYAVGSGWRSNSTGATASGRVLTALSALLLAACVLFTVAGTYAKTGGFSVATPTLDATAYVRQDAADVDAAAKWVRENTSPGTLVLEAKGLSYRADTARISTLTGRPTLLGWDGHQSQWRGDAYGEMARGRPEAIETVYRTGTAEQVLATVRAWGIGYVVVGPTEVAQYGIGEGRLAVLREVLEPAFLSGQVVILRPRAGPAN